MFFKETKLAKKKTDEYCEKTTFCVCFGSECVCRGNVSSYFAFVPTKPPASNDFAVCVEVQLKIFA